MAEQFHESGCSYDQHLIRKSDLTPTSGYPSTNDLIKKERVTAIFAANDQMAFRAHLEKKALIAAPCCSGK